jgi:hypothetical protein
MTFKPAIWRPIALVLTVANVAGAGFAIRSGEGWHATLHGVLAVAFWYWAERLRQAPKVVGREGQLEALEGEVSALRRELSEAQERLDFAERMLAQRPDARRLGREP